MHEQSLVTTLHICRFSDFDEKRNDLVTIYQDFFRKLAQREYNLFFSIFFFKLILSENSIYYFSVVRVRFLLERIEFYVKI